MDSPPRIRCIRPSYPPPPTRRSHRKKRAPQRYSPLGSRAHRVYHHPPPNSPNGSAAAAAASSPAAFSPVHACDPPRLYAVGDGVDIRPSATGFGLGLFAARAFRAGEPITAYTGKLLNWREARALSKVDTSHCRSHIAMQWVLDGRFLPNGEPLEHIHAQLAAEHLGGGAYANDARGIQGARNNAEFDHWDDPTINSDPWVLEPTARLTFLRALTDIAPGDEILVSYGESYWRRRAPDDDEEDD